MNHTKMSAIAVCAALSLAVAGCSNDESASAPDTSSASSSTTQTSVDALTTAPTSSAAIATQGGVTTPKPDEVGAAQRITGQGFTALIRVTEPVMAESMGTKILAFPITVIVESGALVASPNHWAVRTLSSDSIKGLNGQGVTTEIGTASIDSRAEGLVPFKDFGSKLTDDVSVTEVALYGDTYQNDAPLARWKLPEPIAIRDILTKTE
ncbi:hypothetical protein L1080_033430 [Rhodococcus sp. MSC1_016]|uniref:hypothetical protein n=1 Tax=Rhodococcus sp. MSC1_016 TaxID=2909266 RepID=UPI00202F64C9|nr:hypothetical protein [Rhodococcus sp. MSC1_016]